MESDYEELYKWVEEHAITRPKRNINRDFSDAIPLVEILKFHFPKLVDLHNYSAKNSHAQKVMNWEMLNGKVLKKLKIPLTKKRIDSLARGEVGVIEKLLLEVKKKAESKGAGDEACEVIYLEPSSTPASGKAKHPPSKKVISLETFEKMQGDLVEKTEAVEILKNKVDHLENLLNIKEERIKDLTVQLQTLVNQPPKVEPTTHQGSKFFGFFQSNPSFSDSVKSEPVS